MPELSPEEYQKIVIKIGSEVADVPHILPLVQQMHRESYFSDMPFDHDLFAKMCINIRENEGFYGGLYVEHEGEPVGFAYYMFRPFMGSRKYWITVMHTIYIRADLRATPIGGYIWSRMLSTVRAWSVPRGSKGMMFNVISGVEIDNTDLLIRSSGGTPLGGNYFMRV